MDSLTFIQLHIMLCIFFSRSWKRILGFCILHFVTKACKFNSSRKFSLFFTHYSSSAPAKPKFCNPYVSCLRPWRNTILQIMNALFSGYFRNVFIAIILSFCLSLFLEQNTVSHNWTFSFQSFGKLTLEMILNLINVIYKIPTMNSVIAGITKDAIILFLQSWLIR